MTEEESQPVQPVPETNPQTIEANINYEEGNQNPESDNVQVPSQDPPHDG